MRAEDFSRAETCLKAALEIHPDSHAAQQLLEEVQQR